MATFAENLRLGSFAHELGDLQRTPESIEDFTAICSSKGLGLNLAAMGCGTFWQMTSPLESYVTRCVAKTVAASKVSPERISHIVFSTMDQNLRNLPDGFAKTILGQLGLINCVPAFVSLQQCASSLAALNYGCRLFGDAKVNNVIVVTFDLVVNDADRIQPFALFGDAVASCMISRDDVEGLALLSYAVNVDFAGILQSSNFESRKRVAAVTLEEALEGSGARLEDIEKLFSTNVYKPLALFNANVCGIRRHQLYVDSLRDWAHCGNCDWMLNLIHYKEHGGGIARGKKYLVQSSAPGIFSCALLRSPA
jgi:3-oxoacyl-[acyl-carrier-protein] synthase III